MSKPTNILAYMEVDTTWSIWVSDYSSYLDLFVIQGNFHTSVPEDVRKHYQVVEYIMAHAYYHYPMYDEAMRLLGTICEMAIKIRCKELKIPLKGIDKYGSTVDKKLNELIKDLLKQEVGKRLSFELSWIRKLRNSLLHRDSFGFSGGNVKYAVEGGLNLLNKIFLPAELMSSFYQEQKKVDTQLNVLRKSVLVLHFKNKKYLIEKCKISYAVLADGRWHYLLICYPVYRDFADALLTQRFLPLFLFDITSLQINDKELLAIDEGEHQILLQKSGNASDLARYKKHISDYQSSARDHQLMYISSTDIDIGIRESRMDLVYLSIV